MQRIKQQREKKIREGDSNTYYVEKRKDKRRDKGEEGKIREKKEKIQRKRLKMWEKGRGLKSGLHQFRERKKGRGEHNTAGEKKRETEKRRGRKSGVGYRQQLDNSRENQS